MQVALKSYSSFRRSLLVPSLLTRLVRHMAKHNYSRVIVVYPNSGEQWDAQQSSWKEGTGCTSEEFADRIVEAIRLVRSEWKNTRPDCSTPKMIVGGCCRTSPTTICAIRKRLDTLELTKLP
jgi:homocysteine S-methyltransferase